MAFAAIVQQMPSGDVPLTIEDASQMKFRNPFDKEAVCFHIQTIVTFQKSKAVALKSL
ncbi:hypothetical protein [Granulicella mallensis]|uniref:Uncharacterized protein n=1 Tax=Granulicella mallensis TaxID=940614 RepID=A0A7W7ZUN6_9BACT|nr:hypothetical protein [Granulicella mallensis]MBB5066029.1 hypothetical protein [Granulicella mallensis]